MAVPRRYDNNNIVNTVDLLDLLDKRTWKPKDSANHPERRRISILDIMDKQHIDKIKVSKKAPVPKNDKKKEGDKTGAVDLLDVLDKRTWKPKDSAGHPERRKVNILDVM